MSSESDSSSKSWFDQNSFSRLRLYQLDLVAFASTAPNAFFDSLKSHQGAITALHVSGIVLLLNLIRDFKSSKLSGPGALSAIIAALGSSSYV